MWGGAQWVLATCFVVAAFIPLAARAADLNQKDRFLVLVRCQND